MSLAMRGRLRSRAFSGRREVAIGLGVYAAYLTPQGRMISDMRVIETGSRMLLSVAREVAAPLADRFDKLVFSEDV